MGRPVWQVRAQNLGTIAENIFFQYDLEAIDEDTQPVTYSLVAGTLPEGIQLTGTAIAGIPIKITGVPANVELDTTSKFSIRATSTTNEVSDITLDLTVSGQSAPEFITVSGQIGEFFYGEFVDLQLDAIDLDISNTLDWSVINNTLPDGLELSVDPDNDRIAYIRGYPVPATSLPPGTVPGFDAQDFDEDLGAFGFDFGLTTVDKLFEFIISITDGVGFDSSTFSIFLKSRLAFTADTTLITVDDDTITADQSSGISPILTTDPQDLGTLLHDNYFTFQFEGLDFEGDQIGFKESLVSIIRVDSDTILADNGIITVDNGGNIPLSLKIDPLSGWLYGYIDLITTTEETFTFDVVSYKVADPDFTSNPVTFTMTIISDLANSLVISSSLIMSISNGEISELSIVAAADSTSNFNVNATSTNNTVDGSFPTADLLNEYDTSEPPVLLPIAVDIKYELVEGTGALPVGLALTNEGLIIGRPSYSHTTWDMGETIFDEDTTTFDGTHTFDVRIYDVKLGVIDQIQTFTIIVIPTNLGPYENLFLVSGPTVDERVIHQTLIDNTTIIPRANIYREGDEYFGVATDLRFLHVDGLAPATRTQYAAILEDNHHSRRFGFSDLKIAKAEDADGTPTYEIIYADMIDRLVHEGESVADELVVDGVDAGDLSNRVPPATPQFNSQGEIIIKPASLFNMRQVIINGGTNGGFPLTADNQDQDAYSADDTTTTADVTEVGGLGQQNLNTLPDWMTTTQDNGRILGYIPAAPLVYCLPGEASQILFDINQSGFNINEISFDVDRYHWDNNLTKIDLAYFFTLDDTEESFDTIDPNGEFGGGAGWSVNDEVTLTNGAILLVDAVTGGIVTEFTITTVGTEILSNVELGQEPEVVVPDLVPYSLMGYLNDGSVDFEEGEVFAWEVTTGGSFRIGLAVQDPFGLPGGPYQSDNVMSVYDQAGTAIAPTSDAFVYGDGTTVDNTFDEGVEVAEYTLAPGIYQALTQAYNIDDYAGPTNILVAPTDGIGMIGGPAGTPTAVHTGVRYVGKIGHNDSSDTIGGEVAALGSLPATETDLQNRHSAAGWIDGLTDDGHLFQFEVGTAGDFVFGLGTGWVDASGVVAVVKGVDTEMTVYDSAGTLVFTKGAQTGEYQESRIETLATGVYQIHIHQPQPYSAEAGVTASPFSVWITDLTEALRRSPAAGDDFATGNLSVGLRYVSQLDGDTAPGVATDLDIPVNAGTGFTIVPIRPADQPDINDELLKFPKTNVFQ